VEGQGQAARHARGRPLQPPRAAAQEAARRGAPLRRGGQERALVPLYVGQRRCRPGRRRRRDGRRGRRARGGERARRTGRRRRGVEPRVGAGAPQAHPRGVPPVPGRRLPVGPRPAVRGAARCRPGAVRRQAARPLGRAGRRRREQGRGDLPGGGRPRVRRGGGAVQPRGRDVEAELQLGGQVPPAQAQVLQQGAHGLRVEQVQPDALRVRSPSPLAVLRVVVAVAYGPRRGGS